MFALIFACLGAIALPSAILGKGKERAIAWLCVVVFFGAYLWEVTSLPPAHAASVSSSISASAPDTQPCISPYKMNHVIKKHDTRAVVEKKTATAGYSYLFKTYDYAKVYRYKACHVNEIAGWVDIYYWTVPKKKGWVMYSILYSYGSGYLTSIY